MQNRHKKNAQSGGCVSHARLHTWNPQHSRLSYLQALTWQHAWQHGFNSQVGHISHRPPPSSRPVSHPALATRSSLSKQQLQSALDLTDYYLTGKKQTHLAAVQRGAYIWPRVVNLNLAATVESVGMRTGYTPRTGRKIRSSHGL